MSHKLNNIFKFKLSLIAGSLLILSAIAVTTFPAYGQQATVCKEHEINTDQCFICDPSLREKGRLWCQEHSRYEDRCWLCHPDLKEADRLYCEEHGLYEDECAFCHPEISQSEDDSDKSLGENRPVLFCNEHKVPEEECGICQPQRASDLTPGQSLKVRFPSKQSADKAGLRTTIPSECLSASTVEAFCDVKYNENALARITPLASGVIQRVLVDIGEQVEAGDVLVEVNSVEIAEAKASYLSAIADAQVKRMASDREEKLVKERISATRDYQEAKASYDIAVLTKGTARQRLLNYGFSDTEIEQIEKAHDSSSLFAVRAPFRGTLVGRTAVIGELVNPGDAVFTVANLKNMWLELSIPAHQTSLMKQGLDVEARFDTRIGLVTKGQLIWVATSIDVRSRMLKARALIPNEDGWIKAGMFGKAAVEVDEAARGFRIPKDAIQYIDDKPFVFVKEEADLFALRRVALGTVNGSHADILSGISAADQVVTQGSFIAFSEFFKSRLGAGCVDD